RTSAVRSRAAGCWQSADFHPRVGNLPPPFQSHRKFRRRSSRLRKDRPHNARPVFDNRTPRRSAQEPRPSTAQGRQHARYLVPSHVPAPPGPWGRKGGIAKSLNSLTPDVDSADSVDPNSAAPGGRKLLPARTTTVNL